MVKSLVDTSTFIDIQRAGRHKREVWAQTTLRHLIQYQSQFGHLTLSAFTIFEHVDGLYRVGKLAAVKEFLQVVMPDLEVIYADHEITLLGAEINAALSKGGQTIGVLDTLIAATAIHNGLTLVNANTRHFPRIQAAGFPLTLENWRNS